jgi:ribosome-binding protein aMBF1 (putative translation factor)
VASSAVATHHPVNSETAIVRLVGRRVRRLRRAQRWSVENLAARAELRVDVVRQLEAGELAVRQLQASVLLVLANALNVCVVDLLR